jgi:hypothetical protein
MRSRHESGQERVAYILGILNMSIARVLLKQGDASYRFLKCEGCSDGSLLVFLDRDARPQLGSMTTNESGIFFPVQTKTDVPVPSVKFSIHTTGEVHRYAGNERQSTIYIEPLYALTKIATVGFLSIPQVSRLDSFERGKHRYDSVAILDFPEEVTERLTFALELGPKPQQPQTFGGR